MKPIILCFVAYYLPGYRSGGPVRTIANFVDHLGHEFDIRIVTRDRDALDTEPYPEVRVDEWNQVGAAKVFYASEKTLTLRGIAKLIRETEHDVLYLNSFFAFRFTALPLIARKLGMAPNRPCVLAPRGEFSEGALALKALKKKIYLWLARLAQLYKGVQWQASSDYEKQDIQRQLRVPLVSIKVAPDLPAKSCVLPSAYEPRKGGPLRVVFLSRISSKKNLDFALSVLGGVNSEVVFDIYGLIDDNAHWLRCQHIMSSLPKHIKVHYHGVLPHGQVAHTLANYDLFFLPTLGENYGHAIVEALSQGTPVLISDQTPWRNLKASGAGWDLPLVNPTAFVQVIDELAARGPDKRAQLREQAAKYAALKLQDPATIQANRELFMNAGYGRTLALVPK